MYIVFILILLLVLMLFARFLVPILMIVAGIAIFSNIRSLMVGRKSVQSKPTGETKTGRTIEYTDQDHSSPFHRTEEVEAPDIMIQRPASVMDEEFWEKDHTVYDVPYEDANYEDADYGESDKDIS